MRASQFFAINKQIGTIMREEEAQALSIHHTSKPDVRLREIISELNATKKIKHVTESAIGLIARGEATSVASAELEAERERQKANWEEMQKDRAGWLAKQQQKIANARNNSSETSNNESS